MISATASPIRFAIQRTPVSLSSMRNVFLSGTVFCSDTIDVARGAGGLSGDDATTGQSPGKEGA
jgi:hypothetical protein